MHGGRRGVRTCLLAAKVTDFPRWRKLQVEGPKEDVARSERDRVCRSAGHCTPLFGSSIFDVRFLRALLSFWPPFVLLIPVPQPHSLSFSPLIPSTLARSAFRRPSPSCALRSEWPIFCRFYLLEHLVVARTYGQREPRSQETSRMKEGGGGSSPPAGCFIYLYLVT